MEPLPAVEGSSTVSMSVGASQEIDCAMGGCAAGTGTCLFSLRGNRGESGDTGESVVLFRLRRPCSGLVDGAGSARWLTCLFIGIRVTYEGNEARLDE